MLRLEAVGQSRSRPGAVQLGRDFPSPRSTSARSLGRRAATIGLTLVAFCLPFTATPTATATRDENARIETATIVIPPGVWWGYGYNDSYQAISLYFGPYGANAVRCANGIVDRESGHWPYSDNGTHHGIFQLHQGFWGSIRAIAAARRETPDFHNPYQSAWAASQAFAAHRSFRYNWPRTTPAGCP